ncbi:MAG TPA: hypothetical protein VGH93_13140 [Solirubrobacteraceae bacterium]|jgi:hypothetical protein
MAGDENDDEPLRRLEQRLTRASDAAERLISDAARTGEQRQPPPAGWQAPAAGDTSSPGSEVEAVMHAVRALRELIPVEVLERIVAALREVLLALRALIDHYLERLQRQPKETAEVQDIPID